MGQNPQTRSARKARPTEERIVRLPVSTVIRGLTLVQKGTFDSFDEVVKAGIEALTDVLMQGGSALPSTEGSAAGGRPSPVADQAAGYIARIGPPDLGEIPIEAAAPPARSLLASRILLFTVSRFFPLKIVTRELSAEIQRGGGRAVDLEAFRRVIGPRALQWREQLGRMDRRAGRGRGERLSTAFPSENRDMKRSVDRFVNAYVGSMYHDGRLAGASPFMELASLEGSPEAPRIGVTEAGLRFARLENPVLDSERNVFPPFSKEEVDFLLNQLANRGSMEAEHMASYLNVLRDRDGADRETVNRLMRRFYERIWTPLRLSRQLVDSTRAALHGRSQELGLARTRRKGRSATYVATDSGIGWISTLAKAREILSEVKQ